MCTQPAAQFRKQEELVLLPSQIASLHQLARYTCFLAHSKGGEESAGALCLDSLKPSAGAPKLQGAKCILLKVQFPSPYVPSLLVSLAAVPLPSSAPAHAHSSKEHSEIQNSKLQGEEPELVEQLRKVRKARVSPLDRYALPDWVERTQGNRSPLPGGVLGRWTAEHPEGPDPSSSAFTLGHFWGP